MLKFLRYAVSGRALFTFCSEYLVVRNGDSEDNESNIELRSQIQFIYLTVGYSDISTTHISMVQVRKHSQLRMEDEG